MAHINDLWKSLPPKVLEDMEFLGSFSPTTKGEELKGYMIDKEGEGGKVYLDERDLRRIAGSLFFVADLMAVEAKDGD